MASDKPLRLRPMTCCGAGRQEREEEKERTEQNSRPSRGQPQWPNFGRFVAHLHFCVSVKLCGKLLVALANTSHFLAQAH